MYKRMIQVSTQKEFFHRYPGAPDEVAFLRTLHRHMLHFKVSIEVFHNDRDLEFIMVKRRLENYLDVYLTCTEERTSCEDVAIHLIKIMHEWYGVRSVTVEVMEDGENGAIVSWEGSCDD